MYTGKSRNNTYIRKITNSTYTGKSRNSTYTRAAQKNLNIFLITGGNY